MRRLVTAGLLLCLALTGCSGGGSTDARTTPTTSPTPSPTASPPTATAAPRPADRDCYRLDFDTAVAPTSQAKPVDCGSEHTSMTYAVGALRTEVGGHLLAVDSDRVQAQVARTCPQRLPGFLGGGPADLHLSMLRAVWFTPTVEESDAGAGWYRCDVIALASDGELAPLTGRLRGVLGSSQARDRYAMCGTAQPGAADFARVICSRPHSWRAISTVSIAGQRYPGEQAAREAGQQPCQDAGRAAAPDALNFKWGYEWPTAQQWQAGQHYGLCWVPD